MKNISMMALLNMFYISSLYFLPLMGLHFTNLTMQTRFWNKISLYGIMCVHSVIMCLLYPMSICHTPVHMCPNLLHRMFDRQTGPIEREGKSDLKSLG